MKPRHTEIKTKSRRISKNSSRAEQRVRKTAASTEPMQRADELLRKMTIEEKAMQLSSVFPLALFDTNGPICSQLDAQLKHGIGHVSALGLIGHKTPETLAKSVNAIQRYLVTETRLKIPAIFRLSLTFSNSGRRRGTEVVQLYAVDTAIGVTLPAQQLIGFARLDLEPGASKTVTFTVPMSLLAYTGVSGELVMEPGPMAVSAGSSSSDTRSSAKFTVTGKTRSIRGEDRAFLSVATIEP